MKTLALVYINDDNEVFWIDDPRFLSSKEEWSENELLTETVRLAESNSAFAQKHDLIPYYSLMVGVGDSIELVCEQEYGDEEFKVHFLECDELTERVEMN